MKFFATFIFAVYILTALPVHIVRADISNLLITEFQTSSSDSASDEFVEIYNPNSTPIELNDIFIQYKSASGSSWQSKSALSGWLAPKGFYLLSTEAFIDDSNAKINSGLATGGGHLRIYDKGISYEHDKVGWGTAIDSEQAPANAPQSDESAKRLTDEDGKYIDSDNNQDDFFISISPSPEWSEEYIPEEEEAEEELPTEEDEEEEQSEDPGDPEEEHLPEETNQNNLAVNITELFIDPESPLIDSEDEYIELFNPNAEPVNLKDYQLVTGLKGTYSYIFDETIIQPEQYLVLYAKDTGLTLSNTQGIAKLLSPEGEELFVTDEYESAKPGNVWALKDGVWQWSGTPSPGSTNTVTNPDSKKQSTKKATAKKASSKKASTKKSGSTKGDEDRSVYAEPATLPANVNSYVLVGVGSLAVLYALYEYRHDIGNRFHQLRRFFSSRS